MTRIDVSGIVVTQIKTKEHEGYDAIQLGYGMNKKADKPTNGHATKAGLTSTPRFFKESKVDKIEEVEVGSSVNVEEILGAGDIVDVSGISKGKGYAGVVKRHHFKGGPKTHGQSDRHRAQGLLDNQQPQVEFIKEKEWLDTWESSKDCKEFGSY